MLKGKKIIIGITGSIAAYKIPFLIRLLKKEGAQVQVVMTQAAKDFVTPLTLSALSEKSVLYDFFDEKNGKWNSHVELGLWADLFIFAPLSANTLAKMATGIADNLLLTTYLSAKCPVFFAPAMDMKMYAHPTTKRNIEILKSFGNHLIAPTEGELASGLCGAGRMEEPEVILGILKNYIKKKADLKDKTVLVSAGPTYEAIDPVRFIGNFSSGIMGYSIAEELAERGAKVKLVSGPTDLKVDHHNIICTNVVSALEMYNACIREFENADIAIMSAAVADYTPENPSEKKIKKNKFNTSIKLKPTKDILAELGKRKRKNQLLIGFALETDDEINNAVKKLKNKNLDFIVLNSLKDKGAGFKFKTNKIKIIDKQNIITDFNLKTKKEAAKDIIDKISDIIDKMQVKIIT